VLNARKIKWAAFIYPYQKKSNGVEKPSFSACAFKRQPFSYVVSYYGVFVYSIPQ
jgi:hypothetical protein